MARGLTAARKATGAKAGLGPCAFESRSSGSGPGRGRQKPRNFDRGAYAPAKELTTPAYFSWIIRASNAANSLSMSSCSGRLKYSWVG